MKNMIIFFMFICLLLVYAHNVCAGGNCFSDTDSFYNGRRQADRLTDYNNQMRLENTNKPEWVIRQERQIRDLHRYKMQGSEQHHLYYKK